MLLTPVTFPPGRERLATIPLVYLAIAAPAWLLGLPLTDILTVYFKQAGTFERLSMNAANMWLFVPNRFYEIGVGIGLALSAAAGLAYSIAVARANSNTLSSPRRFRFC